MRLFDLHCDTITECCVQNKNLYDNDLQISLKNAEYLEKYIQLFAIWMPDEYRGKGACQYFDNVYNTYNNEIDINKDIITKCENFNDFENSKRFASILTIEGGSAIANDINRVDYLHQCGVKLITLTWNSANEIANGCFSEDKCGLKPFGKDVVNKMQELKMLVDVSHLNEKGFYDVFELSQKNNKPFVATHSNAKEIHDHVRNLTNDQINTIIGVKGLIGVNLYNEFLGSDSVDSIYANIYHMLSLGAENVVSIGGDFDGCTPAKDVDSISKMPKLYEYLLSRNLDESIVDKVFYDNAYHFFINNFS